MLKYLSILFCVTLLVPALQAEQEFVLRHGVSEQFIVYGPKASPIRRFKSERVPLDSSLVAVSCERVKRTLLGVLEDGTHLQTNLRNEREGKIYAVLHPNLNQPVVITPVPTSESLNYRIDLPNQIEATRFIDAVTETILLEQVNRRSSDHFTQIPRWLTQGLSAQVQLIAPETLVLEQHSPITRMKQRIDPIAMLRRSSTNFSALTFDELSWPEILPPERTKDFRLNAQLLVAELLRLKDGHAFLRQMLNDLPDYPRWQIAFMQAFEPHFKQLVDVEKWWELSVVNLTGGNRGKTLSRVQSLERIDDVLQVPVQVFADFGSLPKRNHLTLQKIVSDWEPHEQKAAFEKVIRQLRVLRSRVEPEIVPLLNEYAATLEKYLQNNEKNLISRVFTGTNLTDFRESTRKQLDALDQRRMKFRNQPQPKTGSREEAILSALEVTAH